MGVVFLALASGCAGNKNVAKVAEEIHDTVHKVETVYHTVVPEPEHDARVASGLLSACEKKSDNIEKAFGRMRDIALQQQKWIKAAKYHLERTHKLETQNHAYRKTLERLLAAEQALEEGK